MLYEHYLDLAAELDEMIAALDAHADESTREQLLGLLQRVDLLHREGLLRLTDALRADGAGEALDRAVAADPVVRILLGLYGLADLGLEEGAAAAGAREAGGGGDGFVPIERLGVRRTRPRPSRGHPAGEPTTPERP